MRALAWQLPGRRCSCDDHPVLPDRANGSFQVRRGIVRQNLIDDVLRLLHIDWLERGHSAQTLGEWLWGMHWFPHLTHRNEILALARSLPTEWQTGKLCDPQILLQCPHVGPEPDIVFHVDEEPHWAQGRQYRVPTTTLRRATLSVR